MRPIEYNLEVAIENQNARLTPEEVAFLRNELEAMPVSVEKRCELWNDSKREAYRSMYMNEEA